jgi:hypothetical protein
MTIKQLGGIFGRNPTFNDVDVDGDLSVSGSVVIPNDSISGDAINGGTATLDGLTVDTTTIVVNSTTDSVAINTATPLDRLHIKEDVNSPIATQILLQNEGAGSNTAGIAFQVSASSEIPNTYAPKAAIVFERTNANGGGALKFFSDGTGDATGFQATDEKLRILNTGGITFNGDTAAANALDDYEEGTWTPVLNGSTTNPTYTTSAYYTKIGNIVTVTGKLTFTTSGSGNYIITIASLPFSPSPDSPTGTMSVLDSGTAWYSGTVRGDAVNLISYIGTTIFSSTAPFTVASGDSLNCTITYRTS